MTIDRGFVLRGLAIGGVVVVGLGYLIAHLAISPALSIDGRVYAAAARAWLEGGDPWSVEVQGIGFAAPPPGLLVAAPLALLPAALAGPASVAVAAVSAVIAVRLARVGWWWLLSIPVLEGVLVGSFDLLTLALLLWAFRPGEPRPRRAGGGAGLAAAGLAAAGLAVLAKIYAIVPGVVLGARPVILAGLVALVVTAPFLPWPSYLEQLPELNARLVEQAGGGIGSPWATPWLIPPTVIALLLLGRRDGAWLLVPALWPATQAHYAVFMVPVGSPVLALVSLAPVPAPAAVAVIALAVVRGVQRSLDPWSWVPARWRPDRRTPAVA